MDPRRDLLVILAATCTAYLHANSNILALICRCTHNMTRPDFFVFPCALPQAFIRRMPFLMGAGGLRSTSTAAEQQQRPPVGGFL
jgi:hypothetical protein